MKEEKNSGNQSLIRGLRLIDLLSHYPNGCPLAKLAELSGLNKSTVHRLLQGLQQEGFIQAATTAGSYRLTTKCLAIGHNTITDINLMRKELDEIRAQGFALDKEENELGVTCIAYPIFNFKNEVDYALSVSMSVSRLAQIGTDFLHEAVKETAIAISQALGWQNDLQKNPEI